jgi:anaphase-promoting complex subunit 3
MIEYCKVQPPMYVAEKPVLPTQLASENYQSDPFMSAQIRDRSDLAFNNHPSFFNRLNEGSTSHHLETPTAQTTGVGQGDMLGAANGMGDKTPPIRKTRAAAADLATRKLTSRSSRDPANELKRPVAVASTTAEPSVPPAPARRSTRLNTLKFGSKLGASDRETRLASKERERDQKKRAASARLRSNLIGGMAGIGKDKEKDRVPEDVNVRGYPTSRHRSTSDNPSQNKRKEPPETSLTRDTKKQMPDVAKIQAPPAPSKPQYDKSREEALTFLLEMYKKMGNGYFGLTRYNCQDALQAFSSLPAAQRETPRIQCLIGKAYHEMAQYKEV